MGLVQYEAHFFARRGFSPDEPNRALACPIFLEVRRRTAGKHPLTPPTGGNNHQRLNVIRDTPIGMLLAGVVAARQLATEQPPAPGKPTCQVWNSQAKMTQIVAFARAAHLWLAIVASNDP